MAPLSLSALIERLEDPEGFVEFVRIVRLFTPDYEVEILREPGPAEQISGFARRFETLYFPLYPGFAAGDEESYGSLVQSIPLVPMGYGEEEYHELPEAHPGYRLMSYLIADPLGEYEGNEGARLAIGESCKDLVPVLLLKKVPEHGFRPDKLHEMLDGTRFEALALWASILHQDSTFLLSLSPEALYEGGWDMPDWDMEEVQALTSDWHETQRIMDRVNKLSEWLRLNPEARFRHLLNFILQRRERVGKVNTVNNA